jgi:predicted PurR-regulated permease PerM
MSDLAKDLRILTRSVLVILAILCICACYLAQSVLVPLALGTLLSLLLSPLVTFLERLHIPRVIGSLLMVLLIVGGIAGAISRLAGPAQAWVASAPATFRLIEQRLHHLREPINQAREATQKLEDMTQSPGEKVVVTERPGMLADVLAGTPHALSAIAVVLLLVYFFLSSGNTFLRRLVEVSPEMSEKRVVVGIARGIQQEMSRYLLTVSVINLGVALATVFAMMLLGVPNALLWGTLAGLLNFAPYIGPTLTLITLTLVGLSTFPSLGHALAVPGTFFAIVLVEGQFISPFVIGRRLAINPVIVFVWLLLWGALWGVIGVLLAGPLLACFRILCQHLPSLLAISVLMGDSRTEPSIGNLAGPHSGSLN